MNFVCVSVCVLWMCVFVCVAYTNSEAGSLVSVDSSGHVCLDNPRTGSLFLCVTSILFVLLRVVPLLLFSCDAGVFTGFQFSTCVVMCVLHARVCTCCVYVLYVLYVCCVCVCVCVCLLVCL